MSTENDQRYPRVDAFPFAAELEAAAERMAVLVDRLAAPPRFRSHAEEIDAVVKGIHPDLRGTV